MDRIAAALERDRSWIFRKAVEMFLESEEAKIAERLAIAESPDAVFIPHDEVMKRWKPTTA